MTGALVLTRDVNEDVCIGPDIRVRVIAIRGSKVRLAFTAPKEMRIDRAEVRERIAVEGVRNG